MNIKQSAFTSFMSIKYPNFFEGRTDPWRFEDVISFIRIHFDVQDGFEFRVGQKENSANENQKAGTVLAYAQLMNYTFNQVKSLFSEHDHFAIAIPETKEGRNILEINRLYADLLHKGYPQDIRINQFSELFDIPKDVLTLKK